MVAVAAWVMVSCPVGGLFAGAEPEGGGEVASGAADEPVAEDAVATENDKGEAPEADAAESGPVAPRWGQPKGHYLLREGMKLSGVVGTLISQGGRLQFVPGDLPVRLTVLENAASGEVARYQEQAAEPGLWEVSGMVTEFREANFILIDKATLRSSAVAASDG